MWCMVTGYWLWEVRTHMQGSERSSWYTQEGILLYLDWPSAGKWQPLSYKHKEQNSINNLKELGSGFHRASHRNTFHIPAACTATLGLCSCSQALQGPLPPFPALLEVPTSHPVRVLLISSFTFSLSSLLLLSGFNHIPAYPFHQYQLTTCICLTICSGYFWK